MNYKNNEKELNNYLLYLDLYKSRAKNLRYMCQNDVLDFFLLPENASTINNIYNDKIDRLLFKKYDALSSCEELKKFLSNYKVI